MTPPDWDVREPPEDYDEVQPSFASQVEYEARRLRVREAARELVAAERAAQVEAPPFDLDSLGAVLERPQEPPHRVEGLIPSDGGTLVVAQRKTGKTTLLLNLVRSLVTGDDFLGRFSTRSVWGRVAVLNFEVGASQFARWADDVGVDHDRLVIASLRGRRNPLGVVEDRERLAEALRERDVETLILDPFGRAFTGASQNDAGEVGAWLAELDRWARADVGAKDVVLAAHAGWNGERTRGASALEDWADSIITLARSDSDESIRYVRAIGRDVEVEEDQLEYNEITRQLTMSGHGSRQRQKSSRAADELGRHVVRVVADHPGFNGAQVEAKLREIGVTFRKGTERKALAAAVTAGLLVQRDGSNNAKHYFPKSSHPEPPPASPRGRLPSLPSLPLRGGGEGGSPEEATPNGEVA